jgi:anaphase-promoting complex subunit 8
MFPCYAQQPFCAVLQEYQRAAHVLAGIDTPVAVFLRCYALYLAGEKRKE